jgi:adenylate kinase family enzyme
MKIVQRVAVVGSGGAGKSTFSRELGRRVDLPVIHLDHHYWQPGWTPTPTDLWRQKVAELVAGEHWVVDGNYSGSLDIRLQRADTVIILAFSRWRCMSRLLRRWWTNRGRAVQAHGCPERIDLKFLRWVWRYPVDARPRLDNALRAAADSVAIIELTSPAAAADFLGGLTNTTWPQRHSGR